MKNGYKPNRWKKWSTIFTQAEAGEGILSAVEFLFKNLKKMEGDMVDEIQKKN